MSPVGLGLVITSGCGEYRKALAGSNPAQFSMSYLLEEIMLSKEKILCPLCGEHKLGLAVSGKKILAKCFTPECKKRGVEILNKLEVPARDLTDEELASITERLFGEGLDSSAPPGVQRADADTLHKVYTKWLKLCPVDKATKATLQNRGLITNYYGAWNGSLDLRRLKSGYTQEALLQVPGLYLTPGGKLAHALSSNFYAGILVPCKDVVGRIVALKVRLHKPDSNGKMRTFSSSLWNGPSANAVVHCPAPYPIVNTLWIVEGELKADYCHDRGYPCVSIPGVNSSHKELVQVLHTLRPKRVVLALDQDIAGYNGNLALLATLVDQFAIAYAKWPAEHKGLDDCIQAGVEPRLIQGEEIVTHLECLISPPPIGSPTKQVSRPVVLTGLDILDTDWVEPDWVLPGLLPIGLSTLAGKSKIGKSFLVLDLAVSVATGSPLLSEARKPVQGRVLYLALEDAPRSLKRRMAKLLKGREEVTPALKDNLHLCTSKTRLPRMPEGFTWLKEQHASTPYKLVVIDTLEKFRPSDDDGRKHSYSGDYNLMVGLKEWAEEHEVAVLLVHHVRKDSKDVEDLFDSILGSTGLLGAADTLAVLSRQRGHDNGRLVVAGREVEHTELAVTWHTESGRWREVEGSSAPPGVQLTPDEWLLTLLAPGEPIKATDVYEAGEVMGFSEDVLKVAKSRIGTIESKKGKGGVFYWRLLNGGQDNHLAQQ